VLALDPDEWNTMVWKIEDLVYQNDDLSAALTAVQGDLARRTNTIADTVRALVSIRERAAGLRTCSAQNIEDEIGGIRHDVDVVITALQAVAIALP